MGLLRRDEKTTWNGYLKNLKRYPTSVSLSSSLLLLLPSPLPSLLILLPLLSEFRVVQGYPVPPEDVPLMKQKPKLLEERDIFREAKIR